MQRSAVILSAILTLSMWPLAGSATPVVSPDGVLRYPYGDRNAPTLRCEPLFVCDLVLEPGESIVNVAVGDSIRWLIAPASSGPTDGATSHVLVKPTEPGLRTNLVVTTNRRTYYVTLVSCKRDPTLRIGFTYPEDIQRAFSTGDRSRRSPTSAPMLPNVAIDKLDFNYRYTGDRSIQPARTFSDGTHTYVEMPPTVSELPVVFAVGDDGSDALVNYRFTGHYYIVDGVPQRLTLVDGSGKHQKRTVVIHGS